MCIFKLCLAVLVTFSVNFTYAATICANDITRAAPNSRYQALSLSNNSEVQDLTTKLIWQRCTLGQAWDGQSCTGTATRHTWREALMMAKQAGNGWRVPNIKELQSLLDRSCFHPAINTIFFPNTQSSNYISSSPLGDAEVWGVNFTRGDTFGLDVLTPDSYVRLVRSSSQ